MTVYSISKSESDSPVLTELPFSTKLEMSKFALTSHSTLGFLDFLLLLTGVFLSLESLNLFLNSDLASVGVEETLRGEEDKELEVLLISFTLLWTTYK